ncbi:MAG: alpha/beta hydrolase, partial [Rhodothalassiaceae bacterium]
MSTPPLLSGPERGPADGGAPQSLVIFAHGYGSNGEDLIGLVPHLAPHLPHTQFLSPNAPEPCPGVPGGYQWFPLTTISREERDRGCYQAAPALAHYIETQRERFSLAPDRFALVGFSQGTMMALHVGLRHAPALAGIVGFSGSLAAPGRLLDEIAARPPVLLVHGANDDVVPVWLMFE